MSLDAIKYETSGEINWSGLEKCWHVDGRREDTAYRLFRNKKDLSPEDRGRLFELLDARACYNYAMEVVGGRWEEGEKKITQGGYYVERERVYDSRWKTWKTKSTNMVSRTQYGTKWPYLYALNIVKGRWEPGEDRISRELFPSLAYAKNVLKGRFLLGEKRILEETSLFWFNGDHPGLPPKFSEYADLFFDRTREPGDDCSSSFSDWSDYVGYEIRDIYIVEFWGERHEDFERRVMTSKKYEYEDGPDRNFIILKYFLNCLKGERLPEKIHNYMLREALEGDEDAIKYCEMFPDDYLKAQALGFAPGAKKRVSSKEKFTDEMKSRLENLVKAQVRSIDAARAGKSFEDYIRETKSFFSGLGCETRTRTFFLKRYFPKKGSWKFDSTRTRGLVWFEYDEDRTRSVDCDRYWVGIPEDLARRCLLAGKFPA